MLRTETTTIEGKEVTVTEFPARYKLMYSLKLAKLLPPLLKQVGSIVDALKNATGEDFKEALAGGDGIDKLLDTDLNSFDLSALAEAIDGVLDVMTPEEVFSFLEKFLGFTFVDNQNAGEKFDAVFEGEFTFIFKVVAFTFKVNNFFGKGLFGKPLQK